nr:2A [Cosavirus E]
PNPSSRVRMAASDGLAPRKYLSYRKIQLSGDVETNPG